MRRPCRVRLEPVRPDCVHQLPQLPIEVVPLSLPYGRPAATDNDPSVCGIDVYAILFKALGKKQAGGGLGNHRALKDPIHIRRHEMVLIVAPPHEAPGRVRGRTRRNHRLPVGPADQLLAIPCSAVEYQQTHLRHVAA